MLENLDCMCCTYLPFSQTHCRAGQLFLQHMESHIFPYTICTASQGQAGDLQVYRPVPEGQEMTPYFPTQKQSCPAESSPCSVPPPEHQDCPSGSRLRRLTAQQPSSMLLLPAKLHTRRQAAERSTRVMPGAPDTINTPDAREAIQASLERLNFQTA